MSKALLWPVRAALAPLRPLLARQLEGVLRRNSLGERTRGPRRGRVGAEGRALGLVVVGDSTVNGSGVAGHAHSLAGKLAEALSARTRRPVSWSVLAAPGMTPEKALEKYAPKLPALSPDAVVVGLGANCLVQYYSPGDWESALAALVEGVRARAGDVPVVVTAMPPVRGMKAIPQPLRTHLALRNFIFDLRIRRLARRTRGVFYGPSYVAREEGYLGPDGCHPSTRGYESWGERLAEVIAPLT